MDIKLKVKLKKVHKSWETFHPELKIGIELLLINHDEGPNTVTTPSGDILSPDEMCKTFSNACSYSDIFEKISDEICLKD